MMVTSSKHCLGPNVYPEVPDGGWGWAVAVAFFLVEICTYGTLKSLGVFLQDLMEEFGESNSRVSWVISICVFIFTFTAPLSTMLSNRFGYRPVVMMGGFLISLGTITSAFTNSINEMYITIGIISGTLSIYLSPSLPLPLPPSPSPSPLSGCPVFVYVCDEERFITRQCKYGTMHFDC